MYSVSWSFIELNGQLDLLFNINFATILFHVFSRALRIETCRQHMGLPWWLRW